MNRKSAVASRWFTPLFAAACLAATYAPAHAEGRPGPQRDLPPEPEQTNPNRAGGIERVEPPPSPARTDYEADAVTDRWRILDDLGEVDNPWYDPYNINTLKADRPVHDDWFFNAELRSNTVFEPRKFPVPVSPAAIEESGRDDLVGDGEQSVFAQTVVAAFVYYKGDTIFRPPDYEYRLTLAKQYNRFRAQENRFLEVDPDGGQTRNDSHFAVQEAFFDKHLRDVSPRYDFDSVRIGIQPFNADFRGFLFQDDQFGVRLFGTRDNNIYQYNLAWFRRVEKDTNSGLNDVNAGLRKDDVFAANLIWQDFPVLGFFTQFSLTHNRNREGNEEAHFNKNGFIERPASVGLERPRNYDVTYFGLSGDGKIGRVNLTSSIYYAYGDQSRGTFLDEPVDIRALFGAAELSMDFDWTRVRLSGLYASGDEDPFDDRSTGFDAIFENPIFAGADTNFWTRQNVPLIGGGRVALSSRDGILNSLRSSKEEGQSNFDNPGTVLLGVGTDHDLTPRFRVSTNLNRLWFDTTETIEVARQQADISRDIGWDASIATIYRPFFTQNIVLRASAAKLLPGDGYKQLFGNESAYSVLFDLTFTY